MKRFVLAAILFAVPVPCFAQFIGYVSPQAVQQKLAVNVACTGLSQTFAIRNLGQTQHYLSVSAIGTQKIIATLQGIDAQGSLYILSDGLQVAAGATGTVYAAGYYPILQAAVVCSPGVGSFTLSYSGVWGTFNNTAGSYLVSQLDKAIFSDASGASDISNSLFLTPFGNSAGTLYFKYNAASGAGGSLTVQCQPVSLGTSSPVFTATLANTLALQSFPVPSESCVFATVTYHNSGAAGTIAAEYVFTQPGFVQAVSSESIAGTLANGATPVVTPGNWSIFNSGAGGAQATVTRSAVTGVRHVANCISASAGAAAAPAATVLAVNLRDGASGVGPILWTTNITASATATNHGNVDVCGLNIVGTSGAAMTIEFVGGLANEVESVSLSGYDVQ